MNILQKSVLSAAIMMASSICHANPFNHGDHNDPLQGFGTGSVETLNCGSLSLDDCIIPTRLVQFSAQWCYDKVPDIGDGIMFSVTDSYYTFVGYYNLYILTVSDNGSSGSNYSVTLHYSCYGRYHEGQRGFPTDG
jgi:hypothetical protein